MIIAKNISYAYSYVTVYEQSTFSVSKGEKVGIVGPNGAGKSTLFKLLKGDDHPAEGELSIHGSIGHVPQEVKRDAVLDSAESIRTYIDPHQTREDWELMVMIHSLQVDEELETKPQGLSGGQKTKLALLRAIIAQPDILLLDEPTNFLDTEGKRWIMEFLSEYPKTLLIISHDLPLLDHHINKVLAINPTTKRIEEYKGDYTKYLKLKALHDETIKKQFHNNKKEIARLEKGMLKIGGATEKLSRARANIQRRIERIKDTLPELPAEIRSIKLDLPDPAPVSEIPISAKQISKQYGDEVVLRDVTLTLRRGERVALLGPNGAGKSTFIKILTGRTIPDYGEVERDAELIIGYYSQEFETFDFNKTILETAQEVSGLHIDKIRQLLAKFNFVRERINQSVGTLSGGEKTCLAIALLMLQNYNLLILDEPTTYLDVTSQKIILEALKNYKGTMLFVSHTDEFIEGLHPNRVLYLPENHIKHFIPGSIGQNAL